MTNDDEIKKAIELLNSNNYIVLPITKGQVFLCSACQEPQTECRYSTLGYTCSNLLCINDFIKEQLDVEKITES